jgi:hypothetical protein
LLDLIVLVIDVTFCLQFVGLLTLASVYYCHQKKERTQAVLLQIGHSLLGGILPAVGYYLLTKDDRVTTTTYYYYTTRSKSR